MGFEIFEQVLGSSYLLLHFKIKMHVPSQLK